MTYYPEIDSGCTIPYQVTGGYCALPSVLSDLTLSDGTYSLVTGGANTSTYNSAGQLTGESDSAGDDLSISYDSPSPGSGYCPDTVTDCETISSASGRAVVLGFNSSKEITSVTDPMDRSWTYGYDGSGDLTSATDPMSNETSYTYDTSNSNPLYIHDILTVTNPNGQSGGPDAGDKTSNTYDSEGRVITQTDPAGWETSFNYSGVDATYPVMDDVTGDGQVIVTDPDGNETAYDYQSGLLDAEFVGFDPSSTQPDPSDTVYSLDAATLGDDTSDNPEGDTTQNTYGTTGLETKSIAPATTASPTGAETTSSYTPLDLANCSTSALSTSACSGLSPPSPVTHGDEITSPGSAPPIGATYTEYDNFGNTLWTTTGVYEPGEDTASYSQTTYQLFSGNTLTLGDDDISCDESPPSDSLPCARVNPDGVVTQLEYDTYGDLASSSTPYESGADLATTMYTFNSDSEMTGMVSPDGNLSGANAGNYTTITAYNDDGEVTSITQGDGTGHTATPRETSYGYDGDGNTTSVTDARGYTTNYAFNANDEQTLVTNPDSDTTLTCYDGDGNVTQTVPALGVAAESLTAASCPTEYPTDYGDRLAADATTYTFNAENEDTALTTPAPAGESGHETTAYSYDEAGNTIETVSPPTGSSEDAPDQVTVDTYDGDGELTSETVGAGTDAAATTSYCYDSDGDKTAVVGPDGNVDGVATCESSSPWAIDASSYPTQANYEATTSYDPLGETVASTAPSQSGDATNTTTYCYDPSGNQTAQVTPVGNSSGAAPCSAGTWTVNSADYPVQASYQSTSTYYEGGELESSDDADGNTTEFDYDAQGNILEMTDGAADTTVDTYDPFGELTSSTTASGTNTYYYDADGQLVASTGPSGDPTSCDPLTTSSCSYTSYYTYDAAGNLVSTTNSDGDVSTNYYDADGDLAAKTGAAGDAYGPTNPDGCDPLTTSTCTDTGYYTYDDAGELAGTAYTDGTPAVSYGYEPDGDRCYVYAGTTDAPCSSPPAGAAIFSYDELGRMSSETNAAGATMTYSYDTNSKLTCVSYPNSAGDTCADSGTPTGVVRYSYGTAGDLSTITDWAGNTISYSYDGDGDLSMVDADDEVTISTGYDAADNPTSLVTSNASGPLLSFDASTRNGDSYVTATDTTVGSSAETSDDYSYDGAGEVTSGPVASSSSGSYAYSPEGNVTTDAKEFASASYDQAGVLCWTAPSASEAGCESPPSGATAYGYNADGERTEVTPPSGNPTTYGWGTVSGELLCSNSDGTSCSTSDPTASTTVYTSDGDGLLASMETTSGTTGYVWNTSDADDPLLSTDGTWDYVYAPGSTVPIEQLSTDGGSSAVAELLVSDADNNVRALVQLSSGTGEDELVNYTDYDSYGDPITGADGSPELGGLTTEQTSVNADFTGSTPWGFGGGYSTGSGLLLFVHRYYDPATAQFISPDPAAQPGNDMPYEYTLDNPMAYSDPAGTCPTDPDRPLSSMEDMDPHSTCNISVGARNGVVRLTSSAWSQGGDYWDLAQALVAGGSIGGYPFPSDPVLNPYVVAVIAYQDTSWNVTAGSSHPAEGYGIAQLDNCSIPGKTACASSAIIAGYNPVNYPNVRDCVTREIKGICRPYTYNGQTITTPYPNDPYIQVWMLSDFIYYWYHQSIFNPDWNYTQENEAIFYQQCTGTEGGVGSVEINKAPQYLKDLEADPHDSPCTTYLPAGARFWPALDQPVTMPSSA